MKFQYFKSILVCLAAVFFLSTTTMYSDAQDSETVRILGIQLFEDILSGASGGAEINALEMIGEGYSIEWNHLPFQGYEQQMRRAITDPNPNVDVVFVLDRWMGRSTAQNLVPLNSFVERNDIENFDDLIPGTLAPFQLNDELYGIPFRSAFNVLFYNSDMYQEFADRSEPTSSMEEFWNVVEATTHTLEDGTQVFGFAIAGAPNQGLEILKYAMAYDAQILSDDLEIRVTDDNMFRAIQDLADAYQAGYILSPIDSLNTGDVRNAFSQGLAANTITVANFYLPFNNPEQSRVPGQVAHAPIPAWSETGLQVANHQTAVWAMVIPENLSEERRELAWQFITDVTNPTISRVAALNTNGPIRQSTFSDEEYNEFEPVVTTLQQIAPTSAGAIPAIDPGVEIIEIFREEVIPAILGDISVEEALQQAEERIAAALARYDLD